MAPLYEIVMMTKSGKGATVQLTNLLGSCAKTLWARGAILADIRPWGVRDLAYRIRKQAQNYYQAQYVSMHIYCAPPTLHELEGQLRQNPHVLRHMTLKQKGVPAFDKATRNLNRPKPPEEPIDLEADPTEAAKWEYRNLVMQRVFEGRTKQELVAEQLSRHRFQTAQRAQAVDVDALERGLRVSSLREGGEALQPPAPSGGLLPEEAGAAAGADAAAASGGKPPRDGSE